jgi:hypothetical protein
MVVSVGDNTADPTVAPVLTPYEGLATWTSKWYPVIPAVDGTPTAIPDYTFTVELPVYAGNEYQSEHAGNQYYDENGDEQFYDEDVLQTVNYTVLVEAVQGNAVTDDESQATLFPEAVARRAERGGVLDGQGAILESDEYLHIKNDLTLENITLNTDNLSTWGLMNSNSGNNITLGNGAVLNVNKEHGYGLYAMHNNHTVTLKAGSTITVNGDGASGLLFDDLGGKEVNLVIEDAGLIEVVNGLAGINIGIADVANIYVPSAEAYEEYKAMTVSGAKQTNWYIGDKLITNSATEAVGGTAQAPVEGGTYVGNVIDHKDNVVALQNAALSGDAAITLHKVYNTVVLENVVADVNGNLITANNDNTIILYHCDITLDAGEKIIVTAPGVTVGQVMVNNVTINGVLVETNADIAPYFEGVNWIEVYNGDY